MDKNLNINDDKDNLFISKLEDNNSNEYKTVSISDDFALKDVKMTAGSKMLEDFIPPYTASVVKNVLDGGYNIAYKTNMDEFGITSHLSKPLYGANLEVSEKSAFYSPALAVKNDYVDIALVNDNSGNSRISAEFLNLYGFKPTYGTTSRAGIIQTFNTFGQVSAISKDIEEIYNLYNKIAIKESNDLNSIDNNEFKTEFNSLKYSDLKIAYVKDAENLIKSEEVKNNYLKNLEVLREKGYELEEIELDLENIKLVTDVLSNTEFSSNLNRYNGIIYGHRTEDYSNTTELFEKSRSEGFGLDVKERIILGLSFVNSENHDNIYEVARKNRNILWTEFSKIFEKYDIILSPVCPFNLEDFNSLDNLSDILYSEIFTSVANLYGSPSISIPLNGGILAMADKLNDSKLIYLAKVLGE